MKSEAFNMDCMEYMHSVPDKWFDLAIADPPYGGGNDTEIDGGGRFGGRFDRYKEDKPVQRTGGSWSAKYGKKIVEWDTAPKQEFFDELIRISKNQIIWGANYFSMPPTRCFVIWKKLSISENFSMAMAEYAWTSFNENAKLFECMPQGKPSDPRFHPTQKPVELYSFLLKNFANAGDTIFDPMMGSQSSRIAAYKMGLDFTGCELDKTYFDKGEERFRRECKGEIVVKDGHVLKQLSLFDF